MTTEWLRDVPDCGGARPDDHLPPIQADQYPHARGQAGGPPGFNCTKQSPQL